VVDRSVDERTGFVTRSLLCVPLRGKSGDIFGAFELINKQESDPTDFTTSSAGAAFSDDDLVGLTELAAHAAVALENCQEYEQLLRRRRELTEQAAENARLFGDSPAIEAVRSTVRRVADTDLAVLILGENGTGKEVVSQLIHFLSRRRDEPFIAVNCAALTETLLESELFGHEKGAFTDAVETRQGKFEAAHGGTLFLDEIGELNPSGQAKLLRVLEEKEVVKVGGVESKKVDTRVLAATNRDLSAMVREKRFREDLFYRLNVVAIELPPLRERGDDILLLGEFFLKDFSARAHRKTPKLTAAAKKRMLAHSWPGNVRELRNLMERIAYLTSGDKIDVDEIAFVLSPGKTDMAEPLLELGLSDATSKFQTEFIQRHIQACRGNISEASKRLGLHRSNLYRKMRQLGMSTDMEAASE